MHNSKIVIVSPFQKDKNLYPHLSDFISELELKANVEYFFYPERGYWIEELFTAPFSRKKIFKWLSIVKRTILIRRKFNNPGNVIIAIDNFIYLVCCKAAGKAQIVLWSHDFVTLDKKTSSNFWQKLIADSTRVTLQLRKKIIIQSTERLKLFQATYRIEGDPDAFLLPVSLTDSGRPKQTTARELPILLQIGGINSSRSNSDQLIGQYQTAEKFELMLHGYFEQEIVELLNSCRKIPFLSSMPLNSSQLGSIVAKCDIGFVSYVANDSNFKNISYASGQVTEFLRAGKPLIVYGNTNLNEWVAEKEIGIALNEIGEIGQVVEAIVHSYPHMSAKARQVFEDELAIGKYIDPLQRFIANA